MYPLHPSLLDELGPFIKDYGPVIVALITAGIAACITWVVQARQLHVATELKTIAHNQYITAQIKLNLELFERKFAAYREVLKSIHAFQIYATTDDPNESDRLMVDYVYNIQSIKYLFNEEIFKFLNVRLKELLENYADYIDLIKTVPHNTLDRSNYGIAIGATSLEIKELIETLDAKVYPLLKIKD